MVESRLVLFYIRHLCHYTRPLRCRHRGVPREYVYTLGSCQHALYYTPDTLKYMLRTSCAHLYMDQSNRPALLHRIVCETAPPKQKILKIIQPHQHILQLFADASYKEALAEYEPSSPIPKSADQSFAHL